MDKGETQRNFWLRFTVVEAERVARYLARLRERSGAELRVGRVLANLVMAQLTKIGGDK